MGIEPLARMLMFAMRIVMHMRAGMAYIVLRMNALAMEIMVRGGSRLVHFSFGASALAREGKQKESGDNA